MPIEQQRNITMADEKAQRLSESSFSKEEAGMVADVIDKKAESNYGMAFPGYHRAMIMF